LGILFNSRRLCHSPRSALCVLADDGWIAARIERAPKSSEERRNRAGHAAGADRLMHMESKAERVAATGRPLGRGGVSRAIAFDSRWNRRLRTDF
jgi:hypothetical protein